MLINYKKENVLHMSPTGQVGDLKHLKPGLNEFPKAVWETHKKHPVVKFMIESGDIEEVTAKTEPTTPKAKPKVVGKDDTPIDLKELNAAKAIEFIELTTDMKMLERWEAAETRVKVKKALDKQIAKVDPRKQSKDA